MSATRESALHTTLATAQLPRRVRRALERLYALASDEMARALERMLSEFEQQLFRQADQAANPGLQQAHFDTLRLVRQNRADLIPQFLSGLESALASIRKPPQPTEKTIGRLHFAELRLVEEHEVDEDSVLRGIASRHEARSSLSLHLLGQRFGVLACAPAFDADRLPIGPRQLGRIVARASRVLQIDLAARLELFRYFDQHGLSGYAPLVDAMNATLVRENVLPDLVYVPIRVRPAVQSERTGEAGRLRRERALLADDVAPPPPPSEPGLQPHTGWFGGDTSGADDTNDTGEPTENGNFGELQQMLSTRRDLLGKLAPGKTPPPSERTPLSTEDVMQALERMQASVRESPESVARLPRTVHDVRQAVLAQSRQQSGEPAALSRDDNDAFELMSILVSEIQREVRKDAPSNRLLHKLLVPLLRLVVKDRGFFVQNQHPARQLLNAVAESGASWLSEEEIDPQLNDHLSTAVDEVVTHYHGDSNVFETANHRVQQHLQAMARRAEVTERRHVDAVRGKEKLELAKRRASEAIAKASKDHNLPRFVQTLLANSWTDVLTLTLLRQGEDSREWREQQVATDAIVRATTVGSSTPAPAQLPAQIEQWLTLVGYHADEATAIAAQLTAHAEEGTDDAAASRTELAMKLKARGRLGQEAAPEKPVLPARSEKEEAAYDILRTLPFGTWFEFITNQQGDVVRRRLSWFSPLTDHALFVNQRGQRVGEQSLDSLARAMAHDQARIVTADHSSLVDHAWHSVLGALRGFVSNDSSGAHR